MLLWQARDLDPTLDALLDAAEFLTPFATRFRYPGARLEPEAEEALEAIGRAIEILGVIEDRLTAA